MPARMCNKGMVVYERNELCEKCVCFICILLYCSRLYFFNRRDLSCYLYTAVGQIAIKE
jgi:hypothetical protein